MFKKKVFTPFVTIVIALVCCGASIFGTYMVMRKPAPEPQEANLYANAIVDAVLAETSEILPLVEITKNSDSVTWNESGDKVLMLTFHRYPSSYPNGENVTLEWGSVWTFTDKEFFDWYAENSEGVTDWRLRLNQLLGMPQENEGSHVTAMWVSPDDLIRPAYVTDITKQMTNTFAEGHTETDDYINWFNDNAVYSYCGNTYPWTRLGYTYDWADNGTEYGLTEFLIESGANVTVEYTKSLDDFITYSDNKT